MRWTLLLFAFACGPIQTVSPDAPAPAADAAAPRDAGTAPDALAACGVCDDWESPIAAGAMGPADLSAVAGLAASKLNPGVFYAHNGGADGPRFFTIDGDGARRGEFKLPGASAVDWEDVAVGPCPAGSCLYLADIGDADRRREEVAIYRVAEPSSPDSTVPLAVLWERFAFVYPDEPHDAGTLLVHPATGDVYIVTKRQPGRQSKLFRLRASDLGAERATAEALGLLTVPTPNDEPLTGGDIHPCANRVLLRTYNRLYELRGSESEPFERVFGEPAVVVPVAAEDEGESVAYDVSGRAYLTVSKAIGSEIHRVTCR